MFFMSRGAPERYGAFSGIYEKNMFFVVVPFFGVLGHALAAPGAPPGDPCIIDFRQPLLAIMPISACWTPSEIIEAAKARKKQENGRGTQIS